MESCRVGYHFFTPLSLKGRLVSLLGLSPISHIVISIDLGGEYIHYFECGWGNESAWYIGEGLGVTPYDSLYENLELNLEEINKALPKDEIYSLPKVTLYGLLGVYKDILSCVTCVHRLRELAGHTTKGRTPGAIYKHLKQRLHDQ